MVRVSRLVIAAVLFTGAGGIYLPFYEGWLTNVSEFTTLVFSGAVVALLVAAGASIDQAFKRVEIPDYIKRHRKDLRDKVLEPWATAEIVASTDCGPNKMPFDSYGPIFLRSSADIWYEDAADGYSHLKHRKYREAHDSLLRSMRTMDEHNERAYAIQGELEKQLDIGLSKFPEIIEQGQGKGESKWWRDRRAILRSIEEGSDFTQSGPDIYGGNAAVAYVEKKGLRDDFFRELRELKATWSPKFSADLTNSAFSARRDYDHFKGKVITIIKILDTFDRLEGKCSVEEGKGL